MGIAHNLADDMPPKCDDCGAYHGVYGLEHLKPGEPCGHDRTRPCKLCNQPVGDLSMGGSLICGRCDVFGPPKIKKPAQDVLTTFINEVRR